MPRRLELLYFLAFQLDRELIFHNIIMSILEENVCEVFSKSAGIYVGGDGRIEEG